MEASGSRSLDGVGDRRDTPVLPVSELDDTHGERVLSRQEVNPHTAHSKPQSKERKRITLQVASLNINGYGNLVRDHENNKWGKLYRMMSEHRIGVLLLQETHLTNERKAAIHSMFARKLKVFHSAHPDAPTQKEGVAIVLNSRYVSTKGATAKEIVPGRALQLALPDSGGDTRHILCLYAPTSNGATERKKVLQHGTRVLRRQPQFPQAALDGWRFQLGGGRD